MEYNSDITLYAKWNINSYTVTVNKGTGIASVSGGGSKTYGSTVTVGYTLSDGYAFNGWTTNSGGITVNSSNQFTMPANAVTVTANGKLKTYAVTFNGNGNTGGSTANQTKTHGTNLTLNANGFTKTGYIFNGWNTAANGSGTAYGNGASYTANAAVTLYAQWTAVNTKYKFTLSNYHTPSQRPYLVRVIKKSGDFSDYLLKKGTVVECEGTDELVFFGGRVYTEYLDVTPEINGTTYVTTRSQSVNKTSAFKICLNVPVDAYVPEISYLYLNMGDPVEYHEPGVFSGLKGLETTGIFNYVSNKGLSNDDYATGITKRYAVFVGGNGLNSSSDDNIITVERGEKYTNINAPNVIDDQKDSYVIVDNNIFKEFKNPYKKSGFWCYLGSSNRVNYGSSKNLSNSVYFNDTHNKLVTIFDQGYTYTESEITLDRAQQYCKFTVQSYPRADKVYKDVNTGYYYTSSIRYHSTDFSYKLIDNQITSTIETVNLDN